MKKFKILFLASLLAFSSTHAMAAASKVPNLKSNTVPKTKPTTKASYMLKVHEQRKSNTNCCLIKVQHKKENKQNHNDKPVKQEVKFKQVKQQPQTGLMKVKATKTWQERKREARLVYVFGASLPTV